MGAGRYFHSVRRRLRRAAHRGRRLPRRSERVVIDAGRQLAGRGRRWHRPEPRTSQSERELQVGPGQRCRAVAATQLEAGHPTAPQPVAVAAGDHDVLQRSDLRVGHGEGMSRHRGDPGVCGVRNVAVIRIRFGRKVGNPTRHRPATVRATRIARGSRGPRDRRPPRPRSTRRPGPSPWSRRQPRHTPGPGCRQRHRTKLAFGLCSSRVAYVRAATACDCSAAGLHEDGISDGTTPRR